MCFFINIYVYFVIFDRTINLIIYFVIFKNVVFNFLKFQLKIVFGTLLFSIIQKIWILVKMIQIIWMIS